MILTDRERENLALHASAFDMPVVGAIHHTEKAVIQAVIRTIKKTKQTYEHECAAPCEVCDALDRIVREIEEK